MIRKISIPEALIFLAALLILVMVLFSFNVEAQELADGACAQNLHDHQTGSFSIYLNNVIK